MREAAVDPIAREREVGGPGSTAVPAGAGVLGALWRFGRPHTLAGTALGVGAVLALVAAGDAGSGAPMAAVAWAGASALAVSLAANAFIVGLNQLTDVAIDRVNKPELPLPAGRLTPRQGRWAVGAAGLAAVAGGAALGPWLLGTVAVGMAVGGAYSLAPIRLKGSAVGAPVAIALVRGPVATLGIGAHLGAELGGAPWPVPPGVWLLALYLTLFGLAIGVAKDLPDVEGDREHRVGNLAVRAGARRAHVVATGLAVVAYVAVAAAGAAVLPRPGAVALAALHGAIALGLLRGARHVEAGDRRAVRAFYRGLWRLYYAECVLLPAVALAAGPAG